jgi:O-antigen/teichoic acid export membrane protein
MSIATKEPERDTSPPPPSVRSNIRLLFVSQMVRRIFRVGLFFIAGRFLGVETFGAYAVLLTVVEMVATISGVGYIDYLTREIAKEPAKGRRLWLEVTKVRLSYTLPALVIGFGLLKLMGFSSLSIANAALLSVTLLPRIMGELAQGVLKGLQIFSPLLWIEVIQGLAVLALAAMFVFNGYGLRGIITAEIISAFVGCFFALASMVRHSSAATVEPVKFGRLFRSTFAFNVYPLIVNMYDRADVLLISKIVGNFATGIYAFPYRIHAMFGLIPVSVVGALLPKFSAPDGDDAFRKCSQAMGFLYTVALLGVLGAAAFATPVIQLILGPSYAASGLVIKILTWATIPSFFGCPLLTLLLANGKEKSFVWMCSVCMVFNIGANLLLIPRFSYIAAAIVTILTECVLLTQNLYLVHRSFGRLVLPSHVGRITAAFIAAFGSFWLLRLFTSEVVAGVFTFGAFFSFAAWTNRDLLRLRYPGRRPIHS